jgi:hypothetical protein
VVHHGQSLALIGKTREDLAGIHSGFDYLERDPPMNGLRLLGQVHSTHAAFAEDPKDGVRAEGIVLESLQGMRGGKGLAGKHGARL